MKIMVSRNKREGWYAGGSLMRRHMRTTMRTMRLHRPEMVHLEGTIGHFGSIRFIVAKTI